MSALDFCNWLKGVLDGHGNNEHLPLDKIALINTKLKEVFDNIKNAEVAAKANMPIFPPNMPNFFPNNIQPQTQG